MVLSYLQFIQSQMILYGYPIFLVPGIIGNMLVVMFFKRQRQSACSIYLINSAISNSLYLICYAVIELFPYNNYNDGTIRANMVCKFYLYIPNFIGQVAKTTLVLACIDRYMITSTNATLRAFSTPKRAKYFTFFSYIIWLIIPLHVAIWTAIVNGQCTKVGIYLTLYPFYIILVVGLIPSITLSVFGYLTYRHMREMHNRIQPVGQDANNENNSMKRRDRDLLVIVFSEVLVYVITTSLLPLVLLEMTISKYVNPNKDVHYVQAEVFTFNVAVLLVFINSGSAFYVYLISSKSFRRDVKQFIINSYQKLRGQTPVENVSRTFQSGKTRDTRA